jgi:hypothetical protein
MHCEAAEPEKQPPDRVGSARLTCGQRPAQHLFPQVSPKREHLTGFPDLSSVVKNQAKKLSVLSFLVALV